MENFIFDWQCCHSWIICFSWHQGFGIGVWLLCKLASIRKSYILVFDLSLCFLLSKKLKFKNFAYFYTHSTLHKENVISLGNSWKPWDNCEFRIFLGSEICYFSWNVFLLERPLKKLFLAERSEVHILTCLCTQTTNLHVWSRVEKI